MVKIKGVDVSNLNEVYVCNYTCICDSILSLITVTNRCLQDKVVITTKIAENGNFSYQLTTNCTWLSSLSKIHVLVQTVR